MIGLDEAQARLLALGVPVATERVPLIAALDRWAAEPVAALRTQPARDLSAMDGYAIRFDDLPGPLTVKGESAAGRRFSGRVEQDDAVRIFTGAVIPDGSDTVIMQEDVTRDEAHLALSGDGPRAPGAHIRRAGSDFEAGRVLIETGHRIGAADIGLAAMGGHGMLTVHRRLRVALISTGDELVPPGAPAGPHQIPSSNAPMLMAMLAGLPVDIDDRGIIRDDLDRLKSEFIELTDCDIIITLGGASVGDHDVVRPALEALGAGPEFWKVAMRPGKPVMAGRFGSAVTVVLPGNPVSAYVTAILFLMPLIRHMCGAAAPLPARENATLAGPLAENGARVDHVRARLERGVVTPTGSNDSAMLAALARSNALIVREPFARPSLAGETVEIIRLT